MTSASSEKHANQLLVTASDTTDTVGRTGLAGLIKSNEGDIKIKVCVSGVRNVPISTVGKSNCLQVIISITYPPRDYLERNTDCGNA